jgi:hypothetical protein
MDRNNDMFFTIAFELRFGIQEGQRRQRGAVIKWNSSASGLC